MEDNTTSFSTMTTDEIENFFDSTIGKPLLPGFHEALGMINYEKRAVVGITVNEEGLEEIKKYVPPKPEALATPASMFRSEMASFYAGVNVILVSNQVNKIQYWRDQEALITYLKNKEQENDL